METISDFIGLIPTIEDHKNYWFVRTMGGKLYSAFLYKSIIAIDFDKIEEDKIPDLINGDISELKINYIKEKYDGHKRPGLILSYLKEFYSSMNIGDYVIIPDVCGNNIAVGEIVSDVVIVDGIERIRKDGKIVKDTQYKRTRSIKWVLLKSIQEFTKQ